MIRYRTIVIISICLAIFSCKQKGKIIDPAKFKTVVWDMICADQWANIKLHNDSSAKKANFQLYQDVFALNNISKDDFYTTIKYYESNPSEYKILMDSVDAYGLRQQRKKQADFPQAPSLAPDKNTEAIKAKAIDTAKPKNDSLILQPTKEMKYKGKFKKIENELQPIQ